MAQKKKKSAFISALESATGVTKARKVKEEASFQKAIGFAASLRGEKKKKKKKKNGAFQTTLEKGMALKDIK